MIENFMQTATTERTEPILEVRNLSKNFITGSALSRHVVKAVQGASFKLYPGRVIALVGESGSGKSTIVRMLARLYDPSSGEILYKGHSVLTGKGRRTILRYRSQVQMIFQDPFSSLNPIHKVKYHLRRPLHIHGKVQSRRVRDLIYQLLRQVSLTPVEEFAEKYPHQLSGGQRQRVAIARALAVEPQVILADEPVSMLDVSIRLGILNLMAQLSKERDIAFLYVTHDIASARYFADETLVMYAGYIVEGGQSEELIQDPLHPYTQLLLSAVPDPAKGLRTSEIEIVGEIPKITAVMVGCPFAARCAHVMDVCRTVMPPITHLSETRWVRCYLYEETAGPEPNGSSVHVS
jgi:peptide/nickel transport system ATP-binding protein